MSLPTTTVEVTPATELDGTLQTRKACLGVVGLGTIGLPLATMAAARGFQVIGYDIDSVRTEQINRREVHFEYSSVLREIPPSKMQASPNPDQIASADVIFFCVPTPIEEGGNIDLDYLEAAARAVGPFLKPGALVVLESSVEIGTTRWFAKRLEASSGMEAGREFYLAYCPERYNPGLPSEEHSQVVSDQRSDTSPPVSYTLIPRVVGGLNPKSARLARKVYENFLDAPVHVVRSMEVAEATKLLENIFRDVNIALVNEFATALDALGVDTYEVIQAAATKGFAFLTHYPGFVGGECVPVDTWYLIRQAERMGVDCALMRTARRVNDGQVERIVTITCDLLKAAGVPSAGAKVAVLGTAYKANVHDDRLSPSRSLAAALAARGLRPVLCDPVVKQRNHRSREPLVDLEEALTGASVVILATDHDIFRRLTAEEMGQSMKHRLLVDVRNALDQDSFSKAGFTVKALGRVFHA